MSKSRLNLKEEANITFNAASDGRVLRPFDGRSSEILKKLSESLDDDLEDAAEESIDRASISVPSPWASFLTYDSMLFGNGNDNAVKKANDEWRCLIALTALKPILDLDISYVDVDLTEKDVSDSAKTFADNLLTILPNISIFSDEAWRQIRLITINGKLSGAFSNTSLVCSLPNGLDRSLVDYFGGEGYPKSVKEIVSNDSKTANFDYNNFMDEIVMSSEVKCHYLLGWIDYMSKCIKSSADKVSGRGRDYCNDLCKKFKDFKEDIERRIAGSKIEDRLSIFEDGDRHFVKFEQTKFGFANVQEVFDNIGTKFDFNIESIKRQIKIKDMNVVSFNNLDRTLVKLVDGDIDIDIDGAVIRESDLFTDKIAILNVLDISMSRHLTAYHTNEATHMLSCPIAPIKQRAMDKYFKDNPYALKEAITYSGAEDDTAVKVVITLIAENGKKIKFSHIYSNDKISKISAKEYPLMGIWPYANIVKVTKKGNIMDIEDEENNLLKESVWRKYYLYTSELTANNYYAFKCNRKIVDINTLDKANTSNGDRRRMIKTYSEIPSYFMVIDKRSNEEKGILLLEKPEEIPVEETGCEIGFDFGTTSTTAFFKSPDMSEPEFIKLGNFFNYNETDGKDVKMEIRDNEVSSGLEQILLNNLLSDTQLSDYGVFFHGEKFYDRMAYPSIFIESSINEENDAYTLFANGSATLNYNYTKLPIGNSYVDSNMKWNKGGNSENKNNHIGGYITHMLSSIVFYVIYTKHISGTISLRASYPTALPYNAKITYTQCLDRAANYINTAIFTPNSNTKIEIGENTYMTESISAAMNFMEDGGNFYACIDIGGGSTDISVWYKDDERKIRNLMQSSINLASRDIFRPAFAELIISDNLDASSLSRFQKKIVTYVGRNFENDLKKAIKEYSNNRKRAINMIADIVEPILFEHSDALKNYTVGKTGLFTRKIMFGFYSILYFSVYSIAYSVQENDVDINSPDINMFLAGNGSRLYTWISSDDIKKIVKSVTELAKANGIIDDLIGEVKINKPDFKTLKTEAAKGLLLANEDVISEGSITSNEVVYNGEEIDFVRKDGSVDTINPIENLRSLNNVVAFYENDKNQIYKGPKLNINNMNAIKALVELFNSEIIDSSLKIDTSDKFWKNVYNSANKILEADVDNKQMSSTLMMYVKAVIENI